MKSIIRLIFILVIVALVCFGIYYVIKQSTSSDSSELKPAITSLTLEKPNFVVKGRDLAKVEVWAVPAGTEVTEASHTQIGLAESPVAGSSDQRWIIPVPREPMLLTEIYARGFDKDGSLVGKVILPIQGASDIYSALWLESPQQSLFLKIGESGKMGELEVKVLSVVSDSRCAVDVQCIQAGNVVVELELTRGTNESVIEIATDEDGKPFDGYFIQILDVLPVPRSTVEIAEEDYVITVSVLKDIKL